MAYSAQTYTNWFTLESQVNNFNRFLLCLLRKSAFETQFWSSNLLANICSHSYTHSYICFSDIYWVPIFVVSTILDTKYKIWNKYKMNILIHFVYKNEWNIVIALKEPNQINDNTCVNNFKTHTHTNQSNTIIFGWT